MTNSTRSLIYRLKPLSLAIGLTLFAHTAVHADSNYGPIAQGETLSKIVSENYLVSQYSDAIIMREIFRKNPESFIANNIGLLKQGVNLVLPDDNSIRRSLESQGITMSGSMAAVTAPSTVRLATVRESETSSAASVRLATVQESLKLVREERDRLKSRLSQAESELSSLKSDFEIAQQRLVEASASSLVDVVPSSSNDKALVSLEETLNTVRSEREDVKSKLAEVESDRNSVQARLEAAISAESDLKSQLDAALLVESDLKAKLELAKVAEAELVTKLEAANDEIVLSKKTIAESQQALAAMQQGSSEQSVALIEAALNKQNLEKSKAEIAEKNEKIATLEASIVDLQKQLAEAPKVEMKEELPVPDAIPADNALNEETEKTIADLRQQIVVFQDEVKELQSQNDELVNELMTSASNDDFDASMGDDPLAADGLLLESDPSSDSANALASTSSGNFFTRSIELPTWGALLAFLLLGFTSLLVLLGVRKKPEPVASMASDDTNDVVFRSGSLNAGDQDVESLRVPPRRDSSRVAILDPSMTGELVSATPVESPKTDTAVAATSNEVQSNDSELKLAMAEAYIELSDTQAANELLHEVLLEGTSQQKSSAELMMARLAG